MTEPVRAELSAVVAKYVADMKAAGERAKRSPIRRLKQFFADAQRGREQRLRDMQLTDQMRLAGQLIARGLRAELLIGPVTEKERALFPHCTATSHCRCCHAKAGIPGGTTDQRRFCAAHVTYTDGLTRGRCIHYARTGSDYCGEHAWAEPDKDGEAS